MMFMKNADNEYLPGYNIESFYRHPAKIVKLKPGPAGRKTCGAK